MIDIREHGGMFGDGGGTGAIGDGMSVIGNQRVSNKIEKVVLENTTLKVGQSCKIFPFYNIQETIPKTVSDEQVVYIDEKLVLTDKRHFEKNGLTLLKRPIPPWSSKSVETALRVVTDTTRKYFSVKNIVCEYKNGEFIPQTSEKGTTFSGGESGTFMTSEMYQGHEFLIIHYSSSTTMYIKFKGTVVWRQVSWTRLLSNVSYFVDIKIDKFVSDTDFEITITTDSLIPGSGKPVYRFTATIIPEKTYLTLKNESDERRTMWVKRFELDYDKPGKIKWSYSNTLKFDGSNRSINWWTYAAINPNFSAIPTSEFKDYKYTIASYTPNYGSSGSGDSYKRGVGPIVFNKNSKEMEMVNIVLNHGGHLAHYSSWPGTGGAINRDLSTGSYRNAGGVTSNLEQHGFAYGIENKANYLVGMKVPLDNPDIMLEGEPRSPGYYITDVPYSRDKGINNAIKIQNWGKEDHTPYSDTSKRRLLIHEANGQNSFCLFTKDYVAMDFLNVSRINDYKRMGPEFVNFVITKKYQEGGVWYCDGYTTG